MKSTQQRMEACMDRDDNTHTHTHLLRPLPLIHPPTHQLPLQTPDHAIIGKRATPQSAYPLQFISHNWEKIKSHSSPSQHTALHSQAITGTLERGWLREGRRGVCTQTISVKLLRGTSPALWASSGGTQVSWQQRATVAGGWTGGRG